MARKKSKLQTQASKNVPSANKSSSDEPATADVTREIIESIVIALILAFLFRTFEAEAFVIPTGSMAPTLMGRHKDLTCQECGYPFRISASDEVDSKTGRPTSTLITACTCPTCRFTMDIGANNPAGQKYPPYNGDRILVSKFPHQFRDPKRWEVTVFKFPGNAETNYIKRIVGLPNETLKISHGDLFTRGKGETEFTIQSKPAAKVEAMLQMVHDNDYNSPTLTALGWPSRWHAVDPSVDGDASPGWTMAEDGKSFATDAALGREAWIHYRHTAPTPADWRHIESDGTLDPENTPPTPRLISDFTGYNTQLSTSNRDLFKDGQLGEKMGLQWVGDLAIECEMEVASASGEAILELVEGGVRFQCRIDVATGAATLSIDGLEEFGRPEVATSVNKPGVYRLRFANIDDQLLLWVDGREVLDGQGAYSGANTKMPGLDDLEPVRIGSLAAALDIRHIRVLRDIYYVAMQRTRTAAFSDRSSVYMCDLVPLPYAETRKVPPHLDADSIIEVQSNPSKWAVFANSREAEFELGEDQFFAMGDNTTASQDSRIWGGHANCEYYISRDLLIGKALMVYWPHGWDVPGTDLPIKIVPNFPRIMRMVR